MAIYLASIFLFGLIFILLGIASWVLGLGWWEFLRELLFPIGYTISGTFFIGNILLIILNANRDRDLNGEHQVALSEAMKNYSLSPKESFFEQSNNFGQRTIVVNEQVDKMLVVTGENPYDALLILPKNIVETNLIVDEDIISTTSSGTEGALAGAAIGGLLTGGAGAIIGAIAGKSPSSSSSLGLRRVVVNIVLNIPETHLLTLTFHSSNTPFKKGDWVTKGVIEKAETWASFIKVVASKYN